ncbi:MAG: hypothetical protein AB8B54_04470 [Sphingorhabdus sp.]
MNEERSRGFLPWWVWIIVAIEAGVPAIFGLATWIDPATYIEGATGTSYEIMLYITRNLTTALGIILAVLLRSHVAIFILIIVRMSTDIADMVNATTNGGGESIVQTIPFLFVVLVVLPMFALRHLWGRINQN